jgi:hypothetical protein
MNQLIFPLALFVLFVMWMNYNATHLGEKWTNIKIERK